MLVGKYGDIPRAGKRLTRVCRWRLQSLPLTWVEEADNTLWAVSNSIFAEENLCFIEL